MRSKYGRIVSLAILILGLAACHVTPLAIPLPVNGTDVPVTACLPGPPLEGCPL